MASEQGKERGKDYGPSAQGVRAEGAEREWQIIIRRPGVDGEGVSFKGGPHDEPVVWRFFEADVREYANDEPSATVVLQSRPVTPWEDVASGSDPSNFGLSQDANASRPEGAPIPAPTPAQSRGTE